MTKADESIAEATFPLANLESALMSYLKTPAQLEEPFDTSNIPKISREQAAAEVPRKWEAIRPSIQAYALTPYLGPVALDIVAPTPTPQEASQPSAANIQSLYTAQLQAVPELEPYGPVLRSSTKPVALTESETEYVVTAVKHIFKEHIVFQVRL